MKKQTGIDIIETSAKNSFKITEAMETITKKLMEKNGQVAHGGAVPNNMEKAGVSLDGAKQQNNGDNNCCSLSF